LIKLVLIKIWSLRQDFVPVPNQTARTVTEERTTSAVSEVNPSVSKWPMQTKAPDLETAQSHLSMAKALLVQENSSLDIVTTRAVRSFTAVATVTQATEFVHEVVGATSEAELVQSHKPKTKKGARVLPKKKMKQLLPGRQGFQLQCPSQHLQAPAQSNEKLTRKNLVE
jgi:hypothetical protein